MRRAVPEPGLLTRRGHLTPPGPRPVGTHSRVDTSVLPCTLRGVSMRSRGGNGKPEIESELVDLGSVPLSALRKLDTTALHHSLRLAVERSAHIPVTASGSQGAKRVD